MKRYNPVTAAATAAWTELSSDAAQVYYERTIVNGAVAALEFVVDGLEGWYMAAMLMIRLGEMARAWIESRKPAATAIVAVPAALVADDEPIASPRLLCSAPCAGYLPEVSSVIRPVLVTPAPVVPIATVDREPVEPVQVVPDYASLNVRQLRQLCADRQIRNARRLTKTQALELLTAT